VILIEEAARFSAAALIGLSEAARERYDTNQTRGGGQGRPQRLEHRDPRTGRWRRRALDQLEDSAFVDASSCSGASRLGSRHFWAVATMTSRVRSSAATSTSL
jgi:hypothetical protein